MLSLSRFLHIVDKKSAHCVACERLSSLLKPSTQSEYEVVFVCTYASSYYQFDVKSLFINAPLKTCIKMILNPGYKNIRINNKLKTNKLKTRIKNRLSF